MDYIDYGITIPRGKRAGNIKTYCPRCRQSRKNKADKSLSVNLDEGVWNCHHCGWAGALPKTDKSVYQVLREQDFKKPPRHEISDLPRSIVKWFMDVRKISETTLKALGISAEPYRGKDGREHHWVVFNYYLAGELVTYKKRTADKKFQMFSGGKVIPYNIDSISGKSECIITEGEMDVLALHEAGFRSVISAPTGSNRNLSWMDDFVESHFDDKDCIYVAGDTDEAGRKLRDELVVRLGADRCKLVTWGDDCKDANDVLMRHGKEALKKCIEEAQDIPQEGVFSEADYHNELADMWRMGLHQGMTLGFPNLDNVLSVETKRLMIVTGSGKSEFIDEMCVRLNLLYGLKVAYFSPENMPLTYHAAKIMEKLTGVRMRESSLPQDKFDQAALYLRDNFFHIMPENAFIDDILAGARWLVRKRGVKVVVIDPYNRVESNQPSSMSETNYVSLVLDRLTEFAQRNDCLVILMAHPRKVSRDSENLGIPTMYDINGSANFYNKADFGVIIHRNMSENNVLVRVAKVRFRHLGQPGEAYFKVNLHNGRYYPVDGNEDNRNYLECDMRQPAPAPSPGSSKPYSWREEESAPAEPSWLAAPEDAPPF